jgi:hypothetical protein
MVLAGFQSIALALLLSLDCLAQVSPRTHHRPHVLQQQQIEISGQCLRCLMQVRDDMKHRRDIPLDYYNNLDMLSFWVIEESKLVEIAVTEHTCKTGCVNYECNKSSGAILKYHALEGPEHPTPPLEQRKEFSGQCLRCLFEVVKDLKEKGGHTATDQSVLDTISFRFVERLEYFEVSVIQNDLNTGSITYRCNKSSGAILGHTLTDEGSQPLRQDRRDHGQ